MKKIDKIFAIIVLFLISSCYSDMGNYEYNEINEVTITGLPETEALYYRNSSVLTVKPTLVGTMAENEDSYQYQWTAIGYNASSGEYGSSFELGTEKNLTYDVTLPDGRYKIYLKIFDTKTEVTWRKSFQINVTSATKEGWIILQEKNGDTRLDLISLPGGPTVDETIHIKDLLKTTGFPYLKGPRRIRTVQEVYSTVTLQFILMTDEGTTNLDPKTLEWDETLNYVYKFGGAKDKITGYDTYSFTMDFNYLFLSDEGLFQRGGYVYDPLFSDPINKIGTEKIEVSPYVIGRVKAASPPIILYDQTNKQFVQIVGGFMGTGLTPCTFKESVFPVKTGKTMIYAANTNFDKGRGYAICKGDDGNYWIYTLGIASKYAITQIEGGSFKIEATDFDKAKFFAFHPSMPYMFYATENKVYQFDLGSKMSKEIKAGLNAGETVTYLNFNNFAQLNGDKEPYRTLQEYLIVGSYNASEPVETNGKIRMFSISSNFNDDVQLAKKYDNLSKPIDVTYKEY